jgi:hypothetical protein
LFLLVQRHEAQEPNDAVASGSRHTKGAFLRPHLAA